MTFDVMCQLETSLQFRIGTKGHCVTEQSYLRSFGIGLLDDFFLEGCTMV